MYYYEKDELRNRFRIYRAGGHLVHIVRSEVDAIEWTDKMNGETSSMDDNRNEKRVQQVSLGGFTTTTVKLSTGWVGQISAGANNSVWDSEPFEGKDEALKAANDKLNEKLKGIFA